MDEQTKHLILTPFNLVSFLHGVNPLTDEWMEKRMEIFLNVTYPSLMSQTVMDFEWLIAFDVNTPAKWKEKINKLDGFLKIYPTKPSSTFWPDLIKEYHAREYILTTRIDNDDAFANNAIETIQSKVEYNVEPRYINFLHGLVSNGKDTYLLNYESNSFISRLEESIDAVSVRTIDHTRARGTFHFQQVDDAPPLWMIYIHGLNYGWTMDGAKIGHLRSHSPAPENALNNFNINI